MTDVEALIAFLRAALDEDAELATDAATNYNPEGPWYEEGAPTPEQEAHTAHWDPSRVLAEVEAKRARIAELVDALEYGDGHGAPGYAVLQATVVRLIKLEAQPLSSRPGFKPEWRLT